MNWLKRNRQRRPAPAPADGGSQPVTPQDQVTLDVALGDLERIRDDLAVARDG